MSEEYLGQSYFHAANPAIKAAEEARSVSTVISHKAYGEDYQKCLRCMMFVDKDGKPDSNYYSDIWIERFNSSTRCYNSRCIYFCCA